MTTRATPVELQPPHESVNLDVERLVAVAIELRAIVRHEREAVDASARARLGERRLVVEDDASKARLGMAFGDRRVVEGRRPQAVEPQPFDVDVGHAHLVVAPGSARSRASSVPVSWMLACPSHARSVVLSPGPAAA